MKTIHKFPLKIDGAQSVSIPDGAKLLTIQVKAGIGPFLWALVDTDKPYVDRIIIIRGTGHPSKNVGKYISTFQMHNGGLVFHAFDGVAG